MSNGVTMSPAIGSSRTEVAVIKPLLPARKALDASSNAKPGLESIAGSPSSGNSLTASNTVLPSLGLRSTNTAIKVGLSSATPLKAHPNSVSENKTVLRPPVLPKRNGMTEIKNNSEEEENRLPLSVKERMANLTKANQKQTKSLSSAPSATSSSTSTQLPASLPPRPTAVGAAKEQNGQTRDSSVLPGLPFSMAAKPALPPRTSPSPPSTSSGSSSTEVNPSKHVYQIQDSQVPVPKLTTFSKPRSARTGKSTTSPTISKTSSPSLTTSSTNNDALEPIASNTPPKLPNRTLIIPTAISPANKPADTAGIPGPAPFSPPTTHQALVELSFLPAITRNSQPLPLPSRAPLINTVTPSSTISPSVTRSAVQELTRSSTTGKRSPTMKGIIERNGGSTADELAMPAGAASGIKINSVGSKTLPSTMSTTSAPVAPSVVTGETKNAIPPPLPVRSNTIPITPSTSTVPSSVTPMRLQREPKTDASTSSLFSHPVSKKGGPIMDAMDAMDVIAHGWNRPAPSATKTTLPGSRIAAPSTRSLEVATPETVGVKPDARRRYEALFKALTTGEYIEGPKVHAIYVKSRLDSKTLAQIWDLVDVDNAGRLNRAQFCMGLYLIDERLASGLIPLEISDELWISVMQ
ncbi:hypothetical protein BCR41DRAFT_135582 [Lobosporangium transversale]|uniref:EH domain-containing protein n=1 Tax=Lobosporangium transversale TaxID=64571 RepID=A0A1Y2GK28_9FUNG|nr:hypothetical protein BCR41DRAFT_135582 [Lobosporangium transversale]ORZ09724.1 hypothetical protein BCR41DRAFT_135582 [Lobosporangium transversale]|eukprot:XP_021878994.1 hypothetical protein BCR41DRAFT_135582 [Lobosporangium transversale]